MSYKNRKIVLTELEFLKILLSKLRKRVMTNENKYKINAVWTPLILITYF